MNAKSRYAHSPLTEAVIDLRVNLPATVTMESLANIQLGQEADYPAREDRILAEAQFTTQPDLPLLTGSKTHIGYSFISADKRQVAQARLDGFTFSRLAPYESWASFQMEARRWWERYWAETQPKKITRVAVRYINRLDLPLPLRDIKDYLRTSPEVSPDLPQQGLIGYFMQLHLPQADLGGTLTINEAIVPPPGPAVVSILLDIGLFCPEPNLGGEDDLWPLLARLRQRKNEIFEACITDKTRELIS